MTTTWKIEVIQTIKMLKSERVLSKNDESNIRAYSKLSIFQRQEGKCEKKIIIKNKNEPKFKVNRNEFTLVKRHIPRKHLVTHWLIYWVSDSRRKFMAQNEDH